MPVPRRLISELVERYRLEPSLRDVYVEGPADKVILRTFFSESGTNLTTVYLIETVEVPAILLEEYNLTSGNRQRVIALAFALHASKLSDINSVTGVIDADFEIAKRVTPSCPLLVMTDYACIEGYIWKDAALIRLLGFAAGTADSELSTTYASICNCIRILYILRAAATLADLPVRWLPFKDFVTRSDKMITIDRDAYLKRCLVVAKLGTAHEQLHGIAAQLEGALPSDCRYTMNWHDAVELLSLSIRKLRPSTSPPDPEAIGLSIYMAADWAGMAAEPAMNALLGRVTA